MTEKAQHITRSDIVDQWTTIAESWGKPNVFSSDHNDEFQILLPETSEPLGIFKTWAVPIIPFLNNSSPNLAQIVNSLRHSGPESSDQKSFELTLQQPEIVVQLLNWQIESLTRPTQFRQEMERIVDDSVILDRRLIETFNQETQPQNLKIKLELLLNRCILSLGLLGPFYNLEALLDSPNDLTWNPINQAEQLSEQISPQGQLDVVAFALPSALSKLVHTSSGDWHSLSWEIIENLAENVLATDTPEREIIVKLAKQLRIDPQEIIFAANVLEFIPAQVGGKNHDFDPIEAQDIILQSLSSPLFQTHTRVDQLLMHAADLNAEVRFRNWLPALKSKTNFEGNDWTYASICDSSSQLRQLLVDHPEVWQLDFVKIFTEEVIPQIESLDAESAKARLLIHLICFEQKLKPEFSPEIDFTWQQQILAQLHKKRQKEWIHSSGSGVKPKTILGGKIFELEVIKNTLPEIAIPDHFTITSEAVEDFLRENLSIWSRIQKLNQAQNLNEKIAIGESISQLITATPLPQELSNRVKHQARQLNSQEFAVRSSSFDEDNVTLTGHTGAGIHDSQLFVALENIDTAIKQTLNSFFSELAITVRHSNDCSDWPSFAISIFPQLKGISGTAFSRDFSSNQLTIEASNTPEAVTDNGQDVTTITLPKTDDFVIEGDDSLLTKTQIQTIKNVLQRIEKLTHEDFDIEWIIDNNQKFWLLQVRTLPLMTENQRQSLSTLKVENTFSPDQLSTQIKQSLKPVSLDLGQLDLTGFRGDLLLVLTQHRQDISSIVTGQKIAKTSHLANFCGSFGIQIIQHAK